MRLTIVDYAGDFREASDRLSAGGSETYRAQRYTVEYVNGLASRLESVATVTGITDEAYDVRLTSGVRSIGAGLKSGWNTAIVSELVERTKPDRIILRTPRLGLLRRIARSRIPTLAMLADSMQDRSIRGRIRKAAVVHYLNKPSIQLIGNHGVNAARQLVESGVHDMKVRAWDYPPFDSPHLRAGKSSAGNGSIIYVGMLTMAKGLGELFQSVAMLRDEGIQVQANIVGEGDLQHFERLANGLGIVDGIRFLGRVPNENIVGLMREADVVVVPSRHEYPEGLPLTIYEALCSRSPLVISDHPMFLENLVDEVSALVFKAGDGRHLASQIRRLLKDPELYRRLSDSAPSAWENIQIETTWSGLIDEWLYESTR